MSDQPISAEHLAELQRHIDDGGHTSFTQQPGAVTKDEGGWIPILSSHGPYELQLLGFDGPADVIATDGARDSEAEPSVGVWAAVHADGSARFGWYRAEHTSALSVELEALQRGLGGCPADSQVTALSDSKVAVDIAQRLRSGVAIRRVPLGCLHRESVVGLKDQSRRRVVTFRHIPGEKTANKYFPRHALLGPADRLAWVVLQFVRDDIDPLDASAKRWLVERTASGPRDRNALRRYREWLLEAGRIAEG
ncbi:hypothetical protein AB0F17_34660 [Nonomuraea sp. NPDC026600]|uniref:hypothetical protein n=1 Tax=Nonomuraea sp. NPDC026600 TaxID=3155363 RepID=UPI0033D209DB